jgi:hypothetical protein
MSMMESFKKNGELMQKIVAIFFIRAGYLLAQQPMG